MSAEWDEEEAHQIVARLERVGVHVRLDEAGELVIEGDVGSLTTRARAQLRDRRLDLVVHLEHQQRGLRDPDGVRRLPDGRVLIRQRQLPTRSEPDAVTGYMDWWQ